MQPYLDHVQVAAPPGCEARARHFYGELLDGIVTDESVGDRLPTLEMDTTMHDPAAREGVAAQVLDFARALAG